MRTTRKQHCVLVSKVYIVEERRFFICVVCILYSFLVYLLKNLWIRKIIYDCHPALVVNALNRPGIRLFAWGRISPTKTEWKFFEAGLVYYLQLVLLVAAPVGRLLLAGWMERVFGNFHWWVPLPPAMTPVAGFAVPVSFEGAILLWHHFYLWYLKKTNHDYLVGEMVTCWHIHVLLTTKEMCINA